MRAVTGLKHAARAPEGVGLGCGLGDMRTKLSDKTYINQRSVYRSAYPGTTLPKRPSAAARTNQRTLVKQKKINTCVDKTYQSAFGIPISVPWHCPAKMTLGGGTYQSTYPGKTKKISTFFFVGVACVNVL